MNTGIEPTADPQAMISIESERRASIGTSQIARYTLEEPSEHLVFGDNLYRLDMAMTPRPANARGQYSRHWRADRYEKLGKIWMSLPGEPMRFYSEPGVTVCVHCALQPEAVAEWLGMDSGWGGSTLDGLLDLPGGRIHTLLAHLGEELRAPGFAGEAMVELICGQVAIEISRYWHRATEHGEPRGLAPWRLRRVEERLSSGGETPTLAELADLCDLSVRQLTRGFRLSRGQSIGGAIAARRIEQAKQLLEADHSLKVVAHRLGFASPAGFSYAFRKATGDTPRAFRTRLVRGRGPGAA